MASKDGRSRASRGNRALLTEAFSVGGMARGVSHGGHESAPVDQLAARAAAQEHLRRRPDETEPNNEPERLIDRIPGAVLLVLVAVLVVAAYQLGR